MFLADELYHRVIRVIAVNQRLEMEKVTLDSTFQDLCIDSLDGINILFALEEEFDISIPDDVTDLRSVRQLAEGIAALMQGEADAIEAAAQV
jgi:acyl carrier protein